MTHRGGGGGGPVLGDITNNVPAKSNSASHLHGKEAGGRKGPGGNSKVAQVRRDASDVHAPAVAAATAAAPVAAAPPPVSVPSALGAGGSGATASADARATSARSSAVSGRDGGSAAGAPSASSVAAAAPVATPPALSSEDVEMEVDDAEELEDPQLVAEYSADIYRHLDRTERAHMPRPDYMDSQTEINSRMRAILVDWLVEIHFKYRMKKETLFLAVNIVDRYLSLKPVTRNKLQLVGVGGMLIAAKFEEIYPPETKEYVYITDGAYAKEDVLAMEVAVLTAIGFDLCAPTAAHFLERYQRANKCSEVHCHLLQYLLELSLMDYKLLRYSPSYLVAAAAFVSNMLMKRNPTWPSAAVRFTSQAEAEVRECASKMYARFEAAADSPLQAVRWKFAQAAYSSVTRRTW